MLLRKTHRWLTVNLFSDTVFMIPEPCVVARRERLALLLTLKNCLFVPSQRRRVISRQCIASTSGNVTLLWHVDVRWNTSLYVPSNTRWGLRSIVLVRTVRYSVPVVTCCWPTQMRLTHSDGKTVFFSLFVFLYTNYIYTGLVRVNLNLFAALVKAVATLDSAILDWHLNIRYLDLVYQMY